jgi:putative heme-binding domain-containing protein
VAGQRIFYHPRGAQCFTCHRINARGGSIGPDLSPIGKTTVRERILNSILDPSRDVAPEFVPWMFVMKDGRRLTGVIIEENDGVVKLGDTTSTVTKIKVPDIDRRVLQKGSIMPDKLVDQLTQQELRDLIAFLIANGADAK